MFVLALEADLHIRDAQSLKAKRQVIRSVLDSARHRYGVSASEIADQNLWQRARLGFVVVASSEHQAREIIDDVERLVWSYPDLDVLTMERTWME